MRRDREIVSASSVAVPQHIQSSYAGLTRVSIHLRNKHFSKGDGLPGPDYAKASSGCTVLARRSFSEGRQARQ